jgi:predicted NAD/FAD-binding protein
MSFGVCDENTGIEYSGHSFNTLFAQRSLFLQPDHWRMLADIRRFMQHASEQVKAAPNDELAMFVSRYSYSRPFAERFLIPLASALWSSSSLDVHRFPARFIVEFLDHHGMLRINNRPQWRVIKGGSSRYLDKLLNATRASIRKGNPVIGIERIERGVIVHTATDSTTFDEVIIACHSDQALALLHNPSREECAILSRIRYQENEVVLHTDTSVLPRNRKVWASWNVRALAGSSSVAAITYNMNLLQGLTTEETYCVSLNQTDQIASESILGTFCYHHPIASLEAEAAKHRRHELVRHHRVSYCGAYWGYGFHEDGTRSAYEVCEAFA